MTDPTIRAVIGARIRELRIDRNLTQQQLADITGLTRPNISNIEAGKYSVGIDLLNKIAKALNVTIELTDNKKTQTMRTYNALPKKYASIEGGKIKVIDGFAYAVKHAAYTGERDLVYRITADEYNQIREKAQRWEIYLAEPTEENLQLQIWCWMTTEAEIEPFIRTTPY